MVDRCGNDRCSTGNSGLDPSVDVDDVCYIHVFDYQVGMRVVRSSRYGDHIGVVSLAVWKLERRVPGDIPHVVWARGIVRVELEDDWSPYYSPVGDVLRHVLREILLHTFLDVGHSGLRLALQIREERKCEDLLERIIVIGSSHFNGRRGQRKLINWSEARLMWEMRGRSSNDNCLSRVVPYLNSASRSSSDMSAKCTSADEYQRSCN